MNMKIERKAMKKTITILLVLVMGISAFSQETIEKNKTTVYATVGYGWVLTSTHINAERLIWEPGHTLFNELWLRGSFGAFSGIFDIDGYSAIVSAQSISKGNKLHWDIGLGFTYSHGMTTGNGLLPAGNLGLRFQKPDNSLLVRAGVGFPEFVYLSAGYAF